MTAFIPLNCCPNINISEMMNGAKFGLKHFNINISINTNINININISTNIKFSPPFDKVTKAC